MLLKQLSASFTTPSLCALPCIGKEEILAVEVLMKLMPLAIITDYSNKNTPCYRTYFLYSLGFNANIWISEVKPYVIKQYFFPHRIFKALLKCWWPLFLLYVPSLLLFPYFSDSRQFLLWLILHRGDNKKRWIFGLKKHEKYICLIFICLLCSLSPELSVFPASCCSWFSCCYRSYHHTNVPLKSECNSKGIGLFYSFLSLLTSRNEQGKYFVVQ